MSEYSCVDCGTPLLVDFLSGLTMTCSFCTGRVKSYYHPDVPDWGAKSLDEIIIVWRLTLYFAPAFSEEINQLICHRMALLPAAVSEIETPPPPITDAPAWVQQWIFPVFSRQHKKRKSGGFVL